MSWATESTGLTWHRIVETHRDAAETACGKTIVGAQVWGDFPPPGSPACEDCKQPAAASSKRGPDLFMYVIYYQPTDLPDGFAVRRWRIKDGMVIPESLSGWALEDLSAARALIPEGFVNLGREDSDDSKIVEVWV